MQSKSLLKMGISIFICISLLIINYVLAGIISDKRNCPNGPHVCCSKLPGVTNCGKYFAFFIKSKLGKFCKKFLFTQFILKLFRKIFFSSL